MLWNLSALNGYAIQAIDGNIGKVSDILFDDTHWAVRWLVVDTGYWLPGRKVLLPFSVLGEPDRDLRMFPVKLTRQQVKDSPDIDTDKSVSRQHEAHVYDYYGLDPYWSGGNNPVGNDLALPFMRPLGRDQRREQLMASDTVAQEERGDTHLRSVSAITGYHMHATDGEIGHASDFLVNDADWKIRYICVDTRNWWPGELVLISPRSVLEIDWAERLIHLNVSRDQVKGSPPFRHSMTVDSAYDENFASYYALGYPAM